MVEAILGIAMLAQTMTATLDDMPQPIGTFEITAYAEDEITATGTVPQEYETVAVDPDVIPLGTNLYIPSLNVYVKAEDTGGAVQGNVIDLFVGGTEEETNSFGRQEHQVYVIP